MALTTEWIFLCKTDDEIQLAVNKLGGAGATGVTQKRIGQAFVFNGTGARIATLINDDDDVRIVSGFIIT